jgi:ketosteroid isomerase-like protein
MPVVVNEFYRAMGPGSAIKAHGSKTISTQPMSTAGWDGIFMMIEPVSRAVVEGFYRALASGDMQALAPYLDDDVVWTISGPVDILQFCGRHEGKASVIEMLDRPTVMDRWHMALESQLIDGEHAAAIGKLVASQCGIGRAISYRLALFSHFRRGKLINHTSIIDSFDAVEQVLGHPLPRDAGRAAVNDDLITV